MLIGQWVRPDELDTSGVTDEALVAEACDAASYILWTLSGRKFSGTRLVTEIYETPTPTGTLPEPVLVNGLVRNVDTNSIMQRIRLRGQPVVDIISIFDETDQEVPQSLYRLMDRSVLVLDNSLLHHKLTITYLYGIRPPAMGQIAARHLAQQFLNLWTGGECDLPERVTNISRQGISMTILDQQDFLEQFRTGIYIVDLFLKSANPAKAHSRPKIFTADSVRVSRPQHAPRPAPDQSPLDLNVSYSAKGGSVFVDVSHIDVEPGTVFQAIIRSPSRTITTQVIGEYDEETGSVSIHLPFSEAARVLTAYERGAWDLYARTGDANQFIQSGSFYLTK